MAEQSPYLLELADSIGPRPATSDAEVRAADYIAGVMSARGLAVETQEFDAPRTYSWAYVLYHVLTIGAAVLCRWQPWPALALAILTAFVMRRDLDTRGGLSSLMPKGPSQNVIARHVPRVRPGDRLRRVIVVAHYDTARSSLAFSPGMVRNFQLTFGLMKACTYLVPVFIAAQLVPIVDRYQPWVWYATLAVAAYLVVPLLINVHRELFMKAVPGANDNASGIATMLGVMERLVPEPGSDEDVFHTTSFPRIEPVRRSPDEAWDAGVVPEEALLTYSPAAAPRKPFDESDFDDIGWGEEPAPKSKGQTSMADDDIDEAAWAAFAGGAEQRRPERAPEKPSERRNPLLPGRKREKAPEKPADKPAGRRDDDVRDWLGVDDSFDAKKEGRKIGSWDNFDEDGGGDDDDLGWKGGAAGEPFDDPDFASEEAARIRRRVTASATDRDLTDKEVWFVATGAEEVGTWGMKALLDQFGTDVRDAHIINLDNLGSGTLAWVKSEGMAKRYTSDRRLQGAARRVASENDWQIKGREYRGLSTDATAALARRYKAMSVMAFDINGRLPDWHWSSDTSENVDPANVALAVDFVTALIREL